MTTGEGGMFVTNDRSVFEKALTLSKHGRKSTQSKQFWSDECGFKFKCQISKRIRLRTAQPN